MLIKSIKDRFWSKVRKTKSCWLWTAATNNRGYGVFGVGPNLVYAHRFAFQLSNGVIPPGLQLDHLCRNPVCVNPAHLEIVTNQENARRGWRHNKLRCHNGHLYGTQNVLFDKLGRKRCRCCRLAYYRKYNYKRYWAKRRQR